MNDQIRYRSAEAYHNTGQRRVLTTGCMVLFLLLTITKTFSQTQQKNEWIGTWGTARQLVEPNNMPPAPGLSNNTLRQVVCVSTGGKKLRLKFSNEFGNGVLSIKSVQIATSKGEYLTDENSAKALTFNGNPGIDIGQGEEIKSDPIKFELKPRAEIAITIVFGTVPTALTGHPGSRTTSYLLNGEHISGDADFATAVKTDHWYTITGIEVEKGTSTASVVVFGDSITDGRGSGTNKQNRWPDVLAISLQAKGNKKTGVLNMGIGGNAVLKGGLGPNGLKRFEHDVLKQAGVRWLIIFEGVNDLGGTRDSLAAFQVADGLIAAYDKMIADAHAQGIKVYGATITPFGKSFYYRSYRDSARNKINEWIRTSGHFDAVIDFDKVLRDPQDTVALLPAAQSGDYLHPNEAGYKLLGEAVDPALFK
ncbi:GDSL family lipase [Mucilaginibacter sp. PPCGB 2223]|uniref:SGNH/GDSL hydrolase family protein n=1 Tax=Mucilaginibacter sp. PPCGB 2223 TaxID=1886027 RepID=UPI00082464A3|nr:SGNH/GDSL hydrolase family protein [Mucilaginibacter sp. PPCGB 2223]OCX54105.1 GDSL family lipase [Mucilaginibacter sp. PPCGB 2223]